MGKVANDLATFCTPARLYLALGLIALVFQVGLAVLAVAQGKLSATALALTVVSLGLGLLFVLGYSAALNKFCTWGWSPLSWLLVLGPLVAAISAVLGALSKL